MIGKCFSTTAMYGLYLRDISSYLPLIINELLLLAEPGVRSSEGNWRI